MRRSDALPAGADAGDRPLRARAGAARWPTAVAADYARYEFHLVVQRLQTYCSEDLGGFYLDVLKDRLYTTAPGSVARRSAQTALALIRDMLLKLMAPILSFTAEEAWRSGACRGSDDLRAHVDATTLPEDRRTADALVGANGAASSRCAPLVQKELEAVRQSGAIGSSLQAEVAITAPRRRLRGAGGAGRRPALRHDHVGRAASRWATRWRSASRRARIRNASAAGIGAPTSAPMPRIRRCAGAASPTCSAPANRAVCLTVRATVDAIDVRREPSRWTLRWLLAVARGDRRRPGHQARRSSRRFARARRCRVTGFMSLVLAYNTGAAFSFLAGAAGWQRWFFAVIAVAASVFLVWLLQRGGSRTLVRGAGADPGRRARQLWDRHAPSARSSISCCSTTAAGRGRRSTSPTARSPSAPRC